MKRPLDFQVVRQVLVAPAVQAALSSAAAARPPGAAAGSEGLQAVLPSMLAAVLDRCVLVRVRVFMRVPESTSHDALLHQRLTAAAFCGSTTDCLINLCLRTLTGVSGRCAGLLEATLAPRSGLAAFNILGNAILAEIDEALADALPGNTPVLDYSIYHGTHFEADVVFPCKGQCYSALCCI